jgi:nucleoside-diphosphate-sugar epimerase
MRTLITGANGFVGKALAHALAAQLHDDDHLVLCDISEPALLEVRFGKVSAYRCDLADGAAVDALFEQGFDCIHHLATVPGRAAEVDFVAGKRANLDGTINLLEAIRTRTPGARLVYASSAASYGSPMPTHVDDATPLNPTLSYAAHKAACEILVNDYTRLGFVDGITLRLAGILARPASSGGNASAFLTDVIHAAREGRPQVMPMGADKHSWLMSVGCLVDNLIHAGAIDAERLPAKRNFSLPVLRVSMGDLVGALALRHGEHVHGLVSFNPDPVVEALFSQPEMLTAIADSLGFVADRDIDALLDRCGA